MARKGLILALGLVLAASPAVAARPDPAVRPLPTDSPDTRYCLKVEPNTGSRIEYVRCWTRAEWADNGVDVDQEWASEGVAILPPEA